MGLARNNGNLLLFQVCRINRLPKMASIEKPAAEGITTGRQRVVDFIANHKHECAKGLDEAYDQWATSYDQVHMGCICRKNE